MSIALNVEIKGKGYPILCLHGHPGSAQSMSVFTDHLCQRFQTLAPDLRGYGKSPYPEDFQLEEHLEDLLLLLDRQQISQCLLLGWSLGGIIALELALRYPERFQGLILVATAARPWGSHPRITSADLLFTGIAGIINRLKPAWRWNIDTFARRSLFQYLFSQHQGLSYQFLARDAFPAYLQTSPAAHRALNRALAKGYNCLNSLDKIAIPCLVLAGANDRHITSESSHETAKKLKNCQWQCYPDTAHLFPWEIPDLVLEDIDSWLKTEFSFAEASYR
jgi:pimeloyl-ACP methyl ester carboxylesterase